MRVHEYQALSSREAQARLGQHRRVAQLVVRCISGGADKVPQVVILVDRKGTSGETARPYVRVV